MGEVFTGRETELPRGDPERLGALLLGLEPRLTAIALRFTRDPETARDVVQNAFLKVMRHGDRFRGQARVSTWLHRIVANEALMWLRAERRRTGLLPAGREEHPELPDAAPGPAELLAHRQRAQNLREAIRRLSREERDVVLRCMLSDCTYAEYGARTGIHPAAVKSRAFRARRRLHRLLAEAEALPVPRTA